MQHARRLRRRLRRRDTKTGTNIANAFNASSSQILHPCVTATSACSVRFSSYFNLRTYVYSTHTHTHPAICLQYRHRHRHRHALTHSHSRTTLSLTLINIHIHLAGEQYPLRLINRKRSTWSNSIVFLGSRSSRRATVVRFLSRTRRTGKK